MSRADRAVAHVAARAHGRPLDPAWRVTLNFHPDRPVAGSPLTTWAAICADGRYLSQFATGTSNGGLTAFPGGDRWRWESRLFGGAYDDADPADRPVYGALDHDASPFGGSPRFGSAHLRLTPDVLPRSTFCFPDSNEDPVELGVADRCDLVAAAVASDRDLLDGHVEAHVHGGVLLGRDVEALVLDPCYRATPVEDAARSAGVPVEFHTGFRLDAHEFSRAEVRAYRGPAVAEVGVALAAGGWVDPSTIGTAARSGGHDPQDLKKVWHCLARFGAGATGFTPNEH